MNELMAEISDLFSMQEYLEVIVDSCAVNMVFLKESTCPQKHVTHYNLIFN